MNRDSEIQIMDLLDQIAAEYSQLANSLVDADSQVALDQLNSFCINSMRSILGTYFLQSNR